MDNKTRELIESDKSSKEILKNLSEANQTRMLRKLDDQYNKIKQAITDGKVGRDDFVAVDERFKFPDGTRGRLLRIKVRAIG